MKTLRLSFPLLCGALLLFAGCDSEPESHVVSAPPPPAPNTTVTTTTPTSTSVTTTQQTANGTVSTTQTQPGTIVTTQAPPALQSEVVLAQPTPDHVWIPGFWTWRNNQYEWVAGHWELPPHQGAVWVQPRWAPESGGYRFYEGYWN